MSGPFAVALLGYGAAVTTTLAAIPQIWRVCRTHVASGLSLSMLIVLTTGLALWTLYGILIGAWPVVVANGISCALNLTLALLKLHTAPQQRKESAARSAPPRPSIQ